MLGLGSSPPRLPAKGEIPERLPGLFDTGWLESIVLDTIDWKRLHAELDEGSLHAVAVAATEIGTGRSVVFVDSPHGPVRKWSRDHFVVTRTTRLAPAHALASAAIPMAFPAVQIDGAFYSDGGLRLNTPLSPALRLGADRVLVIGLRHVRPQAELDRLAQHREVAYSNPVYLAGKALDALLLDRVEHDLDRLRLFNAILRTGRAAYGQEFLGRINEAVVPERGAPYRVVEDFLIRPSRDLGELAAECLAIQRPVSGLSDWLSRNVVRYAGRGAFGEADLLSYLFFDRCYTEHLIALGRHDAASAADDLLEFLS
jgi:NTE family protein